MFFFIKSGFIRGPWTACPPIQSELQKYVFYKAHHSNMAHVCKFKCHCLLPGSVWGLSEVSALDCTSLSACLLPMMHLPISSLAKAVKEAIVPVTLRHVACTYDRVGEIIPIIPLECLWINQFCMNKCCSLADFDIQSPSNACLHVWKEGKQSIVLNK